MADDDKFKKPSGGGGGGSKKPSGGGLAATDNIELIVFVFVIVALLGSLFRRLQEFFTGKLSVGNSFLEVLNSYLAVLVPIAKIISLGISAVCVVGIFYILVKLTKLRKEERALFYPPVKTIAEAVKNRKWERITDHINSGNPSDWKLAILEADIILDEMLDSMGYRGVSMGDKLKGVEKSDFTTIDNAWEAHKVRNSIAHEGTEFLLTEREARRIITLYESVFKEFNYI